MCCSDRLNSPWKDFAELDVLEMWRKTNLPSIVLGTPRLHCNTKSQGALPFFDRPKQALTHLPSPDNKLTLSNGTRWVERRNRASVE
jgi:hypothetical protein